PEHLRGGLYLGAAYATLTWTEDRPEVKSDLPGEQSRVLADSVKAVLLKEPLLAERLRQARVAHVACEVEVPRKDWEEDLRCVLRWAYARGRIPPTKTLLKSRHA